MYAICSKYNVSASHALKKENSFTEPVHSHDWIFEVELCANRLDDTGCVVDFRDLDEYVHKVISSFENSSFNEHPLFENKSPSSEVIAEVLFNEIDQKFSDSNVSVKRVIVWEDERHFGSYYGGSK